MLNLDNENFNVLLDLLVHIKKEIDDKSNNVLRNEIAKAYFKILLLELFQLRGQGNHLLEKSPYLDDFIRFQQALKTHIQQEKKVKFYAEKLLLTTKKLNTITQSILHISAKEYILSMVILEAKKYLKCSKMTTKEVAYQLGFDEPTNFTKFFKKHTQQLPSEFI